MTAVDAGFNLRDQNGAPVLALTGDWTVWTIGAIDRAWREAIAKAGKGANLDLAGLGKIDMAGAFLIDRARNGGDIRGADESAEKLLETAHAAQPAAEPAPKGLDGLLRIFDRVGSAVAGFGSEAFATMEFLGQAIAMLGRAALRPQRIRWISVVHIMETAGFNALPIVAMLAFFVGIALAYLGSQALSDLGAQLLTVEMTSASMLRALGPIIAAILISGRTTSAFTAEIGAMKMRQEIDALRVLGLDPFETLVVPRLIALVIMTPILTFVSMVAGMAGGLVICWLYLGISPSFYIDHVHALKAAYFWGGIVKAPLFGLVLALVGCRHGMQTGDDVSSLGSQVTSAVVQGIFLIILLNVVLEFWFVGMGW